MVDRVRERRTMRHRKGAWALGRVGVCLAALASVSSVLILAGPASAATYSMNAAFQPPQTHFSVRLSGAEIPGNKGDSGGSGSATMDLDPQKQTACFEISWSRLQGDVTMFHLHSGARGTEGPIVIPFFNGQHFPGQQSTASGCAPASRDNINAVISHLADHYFNVHSDKFPDGAIRGQLG